MKRIFGILGLLLLLTACTSPVTIPKDVVDVRYESIAYEDDNLVLDVFITNGTTEVLDIGDLELWLELPNGMVLNEDDFIFCGAVYTINETIDSISYLRLEVLFQPGYIFMTQTNLDTLGISITDLELHYEII